VCSSDLMDVYGHVNNVQYFSFFDTAINSWYIENGILELTRSDGIYLVVETGCQFFSEISFPQTVHAGIKVLRLGTASVRYHIALFTDENSQAAAQGEYVHVYVNREQKKSLPIPATHRTLIEGL